MSHPSIVEVNAAMHLMLLAAAVSGMVRALT